MVLTPSIDPLLSVLSGLLYGFSLAVPPGPMNALVASRSLSSYREGFLTGLGAMTADLIFMILIYVSYGFMKSLPLEPIYFIGGAYMIILAAMILRSRNGDPNRPARVGRNSSVLSFISALALGITNPYQILWWISAGLSFIDLFGVASILGLFIAILIWIVSFPLAIRAGYTYSKSLAALAIKIFSVSVMLIFASIMIYRGFLIISSG